MNDDVVLFVEDNLDEAILTLRTFREIHFPYEVVVVHNGKEALDFLSGTGAYAKRDSRVTPLMVILDLKLPDVDGLDLLRTLKGDPMLKHMVVVVFTSSTEPSHRTEAMALGAHMYFRKPTGQEEFKEVIKTISGLLSTFRQSRGI